MKNVFRIMIALTVFLSGVVLVPAMGLPTIGFNWQRYAGVYNPALLEINHTSGSPGSYFSVSGMNFSSDKKVDIYANGVQLGNVQTSDSGELLFVLSTNSADTGFYQIVVDGTETAATQLVLDTGEPQWPQEDSAPVFDLPAGIAAQVVFMPVIIR